MHAKARLKAGWRQGKQAARPKGWGSNSSSTAKCMYTVWHGMLSRHLRFDFASGHIR